MTRIEDLTPGDEFVFNNRTEPCVVESAEKVTSARKDGSIRPTFEVKATGPNGANIVVQRTSTGRMRVQPSAPYGPFANMYAFSLIARNPPPEEQAIRELGENLL